MSDNMQINVFHFEDKQKSFEDFGYANDLYCWYAIDLMKFLGYENFETFCGTAINKAIAVCTTLKIPILDNFIQCQRDNISDYKLSRFACYLTAMNADVRKPRVAAAQAYFATIAESFQRYIRESTDVERVTIRDDISDRETSISSTVKRAGVENYAYFQNSGYLGMYNMNIAKLRTLKGVPKTRSPLDFMGREELAANLFRLTQTELKIRREDIKGQKPLEKTARSVGKVVRETMIKTGGVAPETLPLS